MSLSIDGTEEPLTGLTPLFFPPLSEYRLPRAVPPPIVAARWSPASGLGGSVVVESTGKEKPGLTTEAVFGGGEGIRVEVGDKNPGYDVRFNRGR